MGPLSALQGALAVIGGLFALAVVAGSLYAYAKSSAQEARIERLQGERDDYLSRINFLEPRFASMREQNDTLRTLLDPTPKLEKIGSDLNSKAGEILAALEKQSRNDDAIKGVLLAQARVMDEIASKLHPEET